MPRHMLMPLLAIVLTASLVAAPSAEATDDPFDALDGVYVGHAIGNAAERVTLELRATSLVILDPVGVALLSLGRWELGPGGKGGDLQYHTRAVARAAVTRKGQIDPMKAAMKSLEAELRLRSWNDGRAVVCMNDPRKKGSVIRYVPTPTADKVEDAGVSCYSLTRVFTPAAAPPVAPVQPTPEPDFECMRECRQQNMMRAVGPEVPEAIEQVCRRACGGAKAP